MLPMLEILSEIKGRFPNAAFVAVAPSEERAWQIRHHLRKGNVPMDIRVAGESGVMGDAAIRWADLVLTKSGTATLQVGAAWQADGGDVFGGVVEVAFVGAVFY